MRAPDTTTTTTSVGLLARLARGCLRHRWIVIGSWLVLLVGVNIAAGAVGPNYRTDFTLPDSESKQVQDVLAAAAPDRAGFTAQWSFPSKSTAAMHGPNGSLRLRS